MTQKLQGPFSKGIFHSFAKIIQYNCAAVVGLAGDTMNLHTRWQSRIILFTRLIGGLEYEFYFSIYWE